MYVCMYVSIVHNVCPVVHVCMLCKYVGYVTMSVMYVIYVCTYGTDVRM